VIYQLGIKKCKKKEKKVKKNYDIKQHLHSIDPDPHHFTSAIHRSTN
jgi:hypothetical protein